MGFQTIHCLSQTYNRAIERAMMVSTTDVIHLLVTASLLFQ